MLEHDLNGDGLINAGDGWTDEDLADAMYYCDMNGDESLDACDIHGCLMEMENAYRAENNYPMLFCDCPFIIADCDGMWNCSDIEAISLELIYYYDTNMDGTVNPNDDVE